MALPSLSSSSSSSRPRFTPLGSSDLSLLAAGSVAALPAAGGAPKTALCRSVGWSSEVASASSGCANVGILKVPSSLAMVSDLDLAYWIFCDQAVSG